MIIYNDSKLKYVIKKSTYRVSRVTGGGKCSREEVRVIIMKQLDGPIMIIPKKKKGGNPARKK